MLRDGLSPLGIVLDECRIEGDLLGDKDQQVVEEFEGLLRWKAASQPQEPQLVGEAQPVMRAATLGDLGLVGGGKPDAVGDKGPWAMATALPRAQTCSRRRVRR
jgi:hypothetical protein